MASSGGDPAANLEDLFASLRPSTSRNSHADQRPAGSAAPRLKCQTTCSINLLTRPPRSLHNHLNLLSPSLVAPILRRLA